MSYFQEYKTKLVTPQEAVNVVRSGDWVDYGQFAVQVIELDKALRFYHGDALFTRSCGDARSKGSLTIVRVWGGVAWRPRLLDGLKAQDENVLPRRAQIMKDPLPD